MKPEEIDNLFRENVANIGGMPPRVAWDPDKAFAKIQQGVKKEGRISLNAIPLVTFLWNARSAAVVMLASSLGLATWFEFIPSTESSSVMLKAKGTASYQASLEAKIFPMERGISAPASIIDIEPSTLLAKNGTNASISCKETACAALASASAQTIAKAVRLQVQEEKQAKNHKQTLTSPSVSLASSAHMMTSRFSVTKTIKPQIAFGATVQKAQTGLSLSAPMGIGLVNGKPAGQTGILLERYSAANGLNYSAVGAQVNWLISSKQEGNNTIMGSSVQPSVFATFETGKMSKSKKWTIGLGYLIGSKGNQLGKKALKLFASKTIGKKVHISPEIIISERFGHFMPGVTVSI